MDVVFVDNTLSHQRSDRERNKERDKERNERQQESLRSRIDGKSDQDDVKCKSMRFDSLTLADYVTFSLSLSLSLSLDSDILNIGETERDQAVRDRDRDSESTTLSSKPLSLSVSRPPSLLTRLFSCSLCLSPKATTDAIEREIEQGEAKRNKESEKDRESDIETTNLIRNQENDAKQNEDTGAKHWEIGEDAQSK
jgi:hypothetical protein